MRIVDESSHEELRNARSFALRCGGSGWGGRVLARSNYTLPGTIAQ